MVTDTPIAAASKQRWSRLLRDLSLLAVTRPDRLLGAGWWWLVGKRLRARYRLRDALAALPFAHTRWMVDAGKDDLSAIDVLGAARHVPTFTVHLHVARDTDPQALRDTIASVWRQSHAALRLLLSLEDGAPGVPEGSGDRMRVLEGRFASRIEGLCAAMAVANGMGADYVVPLTTGHRLPRNALAAYAAHLLRRGEDASAPLLVYGDQQDHAGEEVWFKPEWDARMAWSQDYVSAACALAVTAQLDGAGSLYGGILQLVQKDPGCEVAHVTRIVAETPAGAWREDAEARLAALRASKPVGASEEPGPFATVQLRYTLPQPVPRVSIIVATRDRVDLLRTCVEGVLTGTDYPDLELIIADNDSREAEALQYMNEAAKDPRVRVLRWPHPFNYSAINNYAAGFATGKYLCLLNNDIEVMEPKWLGELVREAAQPGVGAVGARLLYPDHSIQHAGIAIGLGNAAGHAHRALPEGEPGYFAQALVARGASAVTGACLLVAKEHFDAVGGLDEQALAVAYNDVDLCLKLRERGLANIYTPAATLIHHESKSRGLDFAPEHLERYLGELAVFQDRWGTREAIDPWHHPRLDRSSETYMQ